MIDIYVHTSPSGKQYVGWALCGTQARWRRHVRLAAEGSDTALHKAIRKYGPESFVHEVLERMTTEAGAKCAERAWIKELDTYRHGYNMTTGGDGTSGLRVPHLSRRGVPHSAEHRARIGEANRRRKGLKWSATARENITGRKLSPTTRANMAEAQKRRWARVRAGAEK